MALYLARQIEEAGRRPTITSAPQPSGDRLGYMPGVPIGGLSEWNQGGSGAVGQLDRKAFMTQLLQAYLTCPWSSACVDVIARTITSGGVECVPDKWTGDGSKVPNAPAPVKEVQSMLKRVNPDNDIRQLMRQVVTDLLIFGDSFTEVTFLGGKPAGLFMLDPTTMSVLSDEHGNVTGYFQQMDTGLSQSFKPFEVIHVRMDDPSGGMYGVSPTQKAILPITVWLFAEALVKETMKRGDPLRAHVDWNIALPESEMRRFQQQYQVRNLGAKNIGNLFETKGGTTVTELGINQISNWMNILEQKAQEIRSQYGVPAGKVGISNSSAMGSGSTLSTEDRNFTVNVCGPIAELVLEKFSFRLLQQGFGITDWHLKFGDVDWRDDINVEQILDMRLRNGTLTLNAYRAMIGQPPVEGGDIPVLVDRTNLVPWADLKALTDANLAATVAQAGLGKGSQAKMLPISAGPTKKPLPKAPRTPNTPKPRSTSSSKGANTTPNPAEALEDEFAAYEARREHLRRMLEAEDDE